MQRIRAIFGNKVQFLRRFFGDSINRESDIEIVDEIDDPVELLVSLRDVDVDVILLSIEKGGASGLPSHIFSEYPNLTLVVVNENCRTAYIENLSPQQRLIPDYSPEGIISALRSTDQYLAELDQNHAGWHQH